MKALFYHQLVRVETNSFRIELIGKEFGPFEINISCYKVYYFVTLIQYFLGLSPQKIYILGGNLKWGREIQTQNFLNIELSNDNELQSSWLSQVYLIEHFNTYIKTTINPK